MKHPSHSFTLAELHHLDSVISLAQEQGVHLDDVVKAQSDICCCGAVTAEAKGKFVFTERDQEIINQIVSLEAQLESKMTLKELIEIRGQLLREQRR